MLKRLILILLCLGVSLTFAQESTEVPAEATAETVVATVEVTPEPSIEATTVATSEATAETTAIVLPTEASPTEAATVFAPQPEPALSLWASDNFEARIAPQWLLPPNWLGNGSSLSITSSNLAYFSAETFSDVAVQAEFQLVAGSSVSIFVRNAYRASLNAAGRLSLWRDSSELATTNIAINPLGHYLRLSAFGDTLRVSIDGQILLIAQDATYSAGFVGVAVELSQAGTVTLDNFGIWLPTSLVPATAVPSPLPNLAGASGGVTTQALAAPNLIAPAVNGVVTKLRPTFSWQAITGAKKYHIIIASNFSCSTVVMQADVIAPLTSFTPTVDLPQGEYWYCVETLDINDVPSGFAEKRRFVINISLLPANSTVITTTTNVTLSWTAIAGVTDYDLQLATDSSFSVTTDFNDLTVASQALTNLPYGQYYWRVAVNGNNLPMSLARSFYISPPLPVAPRVAAPLISGKYSYDSSPLLNWTVPTNWVPLPNAQSITYELQLSTVNNFSSFVGAPVTGIGTNSYEWTATTLGDGLYYWRVRARTNLGLYGAWSAVSNFRVDTSPQAPNLTAPLDAAVLRSARPAFSWAAVTEANAYRIEITQDNNDFDPLVSFGTVTSRSFTPTTSLPQGVYYWRVFSQDAAGNLSPASSVRSFTIDYRISPTADQTFVTTGATKAVSFSWQLVTGASGAIYRVQIDEDINFGSPIDSPLRSTGAWTSPPLAVGNYYWRLLVTGQPISAARPFIVSPALPNAPVLTGPINAFTTNYLSFNLHWATPTNNAGNITGYQVQLSTNSTFTALVAGSPINLGLSTLYTISPDLPPTAGTTYYWRVRAVTNLGAYGAWSASRNFKIDTTAPIAPNLSSPIGGANVTTALPQLRWTAVTGANRYDVRYGLTTDLSASIAWRVTTTSYTVATPLLFDSYYWQVRSVDIAGNEGAWTALQQFNVVSANTAVPSPWLYTTNTPTLTWSPVYWAAGYLVEVSTQADFGNVVFSEDILYSFGTSVTTWSLPEGVYYWRVSAYSPPEAGGNSGGWSATESFTIDLP